MAICLIVCIYVCWASTAEIKTERHVSVLKKRDVCFFAWRWAPHCQHAEAGSILLGDKWPCSPISSHKKKTDGLGSQVWHTGLTHRFGRVLPVLSSLSLSLYRIQCPCRHLRSEKFWKICQDTQHSCQLSIAQGAALPQNEHRNFNSRDSATRRKNDGTNGTQRLHTCGGNKLKLVQNPPTPLAAGERVREDITRGKIWKQKDRGKSKKQETSNKKKARERSKRKKKANRTTQRQDQEEVKKAGRRRRSKRDLEARCRSKGPRASWDSKKKKKKQEGAGSKVPKQGARTTEQDARSFEEKGQYDRRRRKKEVARLSDRS